MVPFYEQMQTCTVTNLQATKSQFTTLDGRNLADQVLRTSSYMFDVCWMFLVYINLSIFMMRGDGWCEMCYFWGSFIWAVWPLLEMPVAVRWRSFIAFCRYRKLVQAQGSGHDPYGTVPHHVVCLFFKPCGIMRVPSNHPIYRYLW